MKNKPKSDWESQVRGSIRTSALNEGNVKVIRETEENLIRYLCEQFKQAKQEGIEEAIKLSDEIEAGKETTFEEWKAFKNFRNTLRDRIELKKNENAQIKMHEKSNRNPKGRIYLH